MSDDAILALVRHQLEAVSVLATGARGVTHAPARRGARRTARSAPPVVAAAPARRGRPPGPKKAPKAARKGRRRRADSAEREQLLGTIEKLVKGSSGMSASEVSKSAGLPQTRVASALKELKIAKRIYQGGDRRFARYAGDAKSAEQASLSARKSASGPTRLGKKAGKKRGK